MKKTKIGSSIIVCIISLMIIIAAIIFLYIGNPKSNISSPDHDNESANNKTVVPGDESKIYESISGISHQSVNLLPELSHEKVKELIKNIEKPNSYCWYYDSTVYSSKKSATTSGVMKVDDESFRIELYSKDGNVFKTVIGESESITVQNNIHGTLSEFNSSSTDVFTEAGVPDISMFLSNEASEFDYTLITSEYGTILYAKFNNIKDNYLQTEEYYISLDFGIVIRADCYENEGLIYSLSTTALYELDE